MTTQTAAGFQFPPLPVIIALAKTPTTKLTDKEINEGLQIRTFLGNQDMSVASFAQDFLSNRRPDWLPVIANMKSSNSTSTGVSALIKFGDNENDFRVNIQQQQNGDSVNMKSMTIGLCLFLSEGSDQPCMLDPNDNIHNLVNGCNLATKGPPQLRICLTNFWSANLHDNNANNGSMLKTFTLIMKKNDILQIQHSADHQVSSISRDRASSTVSETDSNKKRKRDPNQPKRGASAYTFYLKEQRHIVQEKNSDKSFSEISKILGQQWKDLSDEDRKKYDDMSGQDKKRYEEEMAKYVPPQTIVHEEDDNKKKKKKKKDPNAPKQARNIYWYYCNEARPKAAKENPDMGLPELSKLISQGYKKLSDKEKEKYQKLADEDKKRFLKEQEAYAAGKSISNSVEKEKVDKADDQNTTQETIPVTKSKRKSLQVGSPNGKITPKKKKSHNKDETPAESKSSSSKHKKDRKKKKTKE